MSEKPPPPNRNTEVTALVEETLYIYIHCAYFCQRFFFLYFIYLPVLFQALSEALQPSNPFVMDSPLVKSPSFQKQGIVACVLTLLSQMRMGSNNSEFQTGFQSIH
jgi:hypothetical protein